MSSKSQTVSSTSHAAHPLTVGRASLVLIPGGLLALLSTTIVGVTTPDIISELGTGISSAQWITTIYLLTAGLGIAASGWASARYGVKHVWLISMSLYTGGALGSAIAPEIPTLVAARAFQGLGGGALEPLMLTTLARTAGPAKMGRVMGTVAAVMALGPLAGPALGGLAVDGFGWRVTFGSTALLGAIVTAGSALVLRREATQSSRLDLPGLLLVAAATVLTLAGLSRVATPAGPDAAALGLLVGGVTTLAAFVWWAQHRRERAIINLATFGSRGFGPAVLIMALMGAAIYPLFFGLPQFFQGVSGLTPAAAGLLMIPYGLGNLFAMPVTGSLSDALGSRRLIWAGASITIVGFTLLIFTGPDTALPWYALLMLLLGLGLGAIGAPTVSSLYRILAPELIPSGSSTLFIVNQFGGSLGVALLTILIGGTTWGPQIGTTPLWVPVIATVAIALTATRINDSHDEPGRPHAATATTA